MKDRSLNIIIFISILAIIFLFWLIYFAPVAQTDSSFVTILPPLNALLNSLSASALTIGVWHAKKGNIKTHKRFLFSAFIFSALFLLSYITYHHFHGDTKFLAQGLIRPIYFFILISHILLSIIALPMVLNTFYLGVTNKAQKHKKWAKWTFPIWLYVSVTGVLIFVILKLFNN